MSNAFTADRIGVHTTAPVVALDVDGGFALRAVSPAALAAVENDYAGAATASALRVITDPGGTTITGFASGQNGRLLKITNLGPAALTLSNEGLGSLAPNRLLTTIGQSLVLIPNGSVILTYDATTLRWRESTQASSAPMQIVFGDPGGIPAGVRFMRPGSATASTNEIKIHMAWNVGFRSISVQSLTPPGGARTDTFTLRKNGVSTTVTISLTAAAVDGSSTANIAQFSAGDDVSLMAVTSAGSTTTDVIVVVEAY